MEAIHVHQKCENVSRSRPLSGDTELIASNVVETRISFCSVHIFLLIKAWNLKLKASCSYTSTRHRTSLRTEQHFIYSFHGAYREVCRARKTDVLDRLSFSLLPMLSLPSAVEGPHYGAICMQTGAFPYWNRFDFRSRAFLSRIRQRAHSGPAYARIAASQHRDCRWTPMLIQTLENRRAWKPITLSLTEPNPFKLILLALGLNPNISELSHQVCKCSSCSILFSQGSVALSP